MADIIFSIYLIFLIVCAYFAISKRGIRLQQEYYAFKNTKHFYAKNGIKWP